MLLATESYELELPMPIPDKIAAANKINEFLHGVVANAGLHLKYRITVDPPLAEERDWERPEILVEFAGPDSPLVLERGGELLRSIELLAIEMLRLPGNEHEKISFDCMNHRSHAHRGAAHGGHRGGGESPQDRSAVQVRAHVVARAPHRAPGAARSSRSASPRAKAKVCADAWWSIRRITRARRQAAPKYPIVWIPSDLNVTACRARARAARYKFLASTRVNLDDTIVAIATPQGRGGIGVVRLAGPEARRHCGSHASA